MRKSILSLFSIGFCFLHSGVFAVEEGVISPVPGGSPLLGDEPESHFHLSGGPELGAMRMVDVEGMPFAHAVELRTLRTPDKPWTVELGQRISKPFRKGDTLWISVWMRATETSNEAQQGFSQITMDQAFGGHDRLAPILDLDAGASWQQYAWAITARGDGPQEQVQLCFRGGFKPQSIQLGGLQILDYGQCVKSSELPHSKITYPGMEPNAAWRQAANERIEKFRKADVKVEVKDAAGKPLSGATVRIQQVRHAFGFGSCIASHALLVSGADGDHYRQIVKDHYSKVVLENDLKWIAWERNAADHKPTMDSLKWLKDQGIAVRGHNLVWPGWRFTPNDLPLLKNDKATLTKRIEDHITEEVNVIKGQVTEWDVVNEPYSEHDILDLLGPETMAAWFKLVHQLDPRADLYLNDYAGLVNRGANTPHKEASEQMLKNLIDEGAPIAGLGIQAHFGSQLTGPDLLVNELDRWAAPGLEIQITEFDIDVPDEDLQARYLHDFMTAVFSHPAVNAIVMWGFWEGCHWRPRAALYRKDWSIKPSGQTWNDLVLKQWHTDATTNTDASGSASTRGFLGDYEITVTYRGKSKKWTLTLPKQGTVLSAVLPPE